MNVFFHNNDVYNVLLMQLDIYFEKKFFHMPLLPKNDRYFSIKKKNIYIDVCVHIDCHLVGGK